MSKNNQVNPNSKGNQDNQDNQKNQDNRNIQNKEAQNNMNNQANNVENSKVDATAKQIISQAVAQVQVMLVLLQTDKTTLTLPKFNLA